MEIISLDNFRKKHDLKNLNEDVFQILKENFSYFQNHEDNEKITDYNFERGPLLYGLIEKYQPNNTLEIGTSNGYGTLSMTYALKISSSKIFTIDVIDNEEKNIHYIKNNETIEKILISRRELWGKYAKNDRLEKIISLNGYSSDILTNFDFPPIDFFYIDGGHFYDAFKFDFFSCINLANSKSYFLCDDYIERDDYGVKKFIDESLEPIVKITLIKTDKSELYLKNGITNTDYGMCFFEINKSDITKYFSEKEISSFKNEFLKFEKRYKLRKKINKKIPFLNNIRFRKLF